MILKRDCSSEHQSISMTKQEKNRLAAVLRATEYLFLENIALKLVLEHREVANWQKLLERLVTDQEMLAGVRLKFRDVYQEIEASTDPSGALEALLGELPAPKKTHSRSTRGRLRQAAYYSVCLGLAPDDSPLLRRDTGTHEIYALDWLAP